MITNPTGGAARVWGWLTPCGHHSRVEKTPGEIQSACASVSAGWLAGRDGGEVEREGDTGDAGTERRGALLTALTPLGHGAFFAASIVPPRWSLLLFHRSPLTRLIGVEGR